MLGKIFGFLVDIVINGFIAFFFTIVVKFVMLLIAYPISYMAGDQVANSYSQLFYGHGLAVRLIYIIIFTSLMMNDLGFKNLKTYFKQWFGGQTKQKLTC